MPHTPDPYEVDENENAPDAAATAIEGNDQHPSEENQL